MAKFVSRKAPVSVASLKRRPAGAVIVRHYGRVDVRFMRVNGGWLRQRTDVTSDPAVVVSSAATAAECNSAVGARDSWARVY